MTVAQAQARLVIVRAAIDAAIAAGGVVSYSTGDGRSVNRDLKWLTDEEARLESIVSRGSGGLFAVARFPSERSSGRGCRDFRTD